MANISMGNSKMGTMPNINLPRSVCRRDVPCQKHCYAKKGNYTYTRNQNSYKSNLAEFIADPEAYFESINNFLDNDAVIYKYFRWHTSGDIVNMEYLIGIVDVALQNPHTKFLCYTKKFDLVNIYLSVHDEGFPKNLNVVFSGWDKNFVIPNPFNLPTTYVLFGNENDVKKPNAPICPGDCRKCKLCWLLKEGEELLFNVH